MSQPFPLPEARRLAKGYFEPNPLIYWSDLLLTAAIGWGAFGLAVLAAPLSLWQSLCLLVASLALYRGMIFTHELSHFSDARFPLFRVVWNLLCGIPLLAPSFMYRGVHMEHHRIKVYGTQGDGEYLPFARGRRGKIPLFLAQSFVLPLLIAVRYILLTPLCWVSPSLRRLVWQRASSLSIDVEYRRPLEQMTESNDWRWQELGAFVFAGSAVLLVLANVLPATVLAIWYGVMVLILLVNSVRTLVAHRYVNGEGRAMTIAEQFLDSVNIPGNAFLTPLWAPVGLRYHATHHLFPAMPYHNLGRVHRRLVNELEDNSQYLEASRAGLIPALVELWRSAGSSRV
jgi:fatty acid desaturase